MKKDIFKIGYEILQQDLFSKVENHINCIAILDNNDNIVQSKSCNPESIKYLKQCDFSDSRGDEGFTSESESIQLFDEPFLVVYGYINEKYTLVIVYNTDKGLTFGDGSKCFKTILKNLMNQARERSI
ncbi:MAG: hypothetical protein ACFFAS_06975 [Promethearchaeota archaeon]